MNDQPVTDKPRAPALARFLRQMVKLLATGLVIAYVVNKLGGTILFLHVKGSTRCMLYAGLPSAWRA